MIIHALIKKLTVTQSGGKHEGDPVVKKGVVTIEVDDADDWQLSEISELMDGLQHRIAVNEP